jgi:hypothetical protein
MGGRFLKGLAYLALLCIVALTSCQAAVSLTGPAELPTAIRS